MGLRLTRDTLVTVETSTPSIPRANILLKSLFCWKKRDLWDNKDINYIWFTNFKPDNISSSKVS